MLDIEKLELDARSYIGVTGKSGAGKSTFIDLITGLLEATDGSIEIDDKLLNKDLKPLWQVILLMCHNKASSLMILLPEILLLE